MRWRIIATTHHCTRFTLRTIEPCYTSQIAFTTVTHDTLITPSFLVIVRSTTYTESTVWLIIYRMNGTPCLSIKDCQVFWTSQNPSFLVPVVCLIVCLTDFRVIGNLCNVVPYTIQGSWCCLAYHFCFAITVKVVHHKLGIVGTCSDIFTKIYTPKLCTIQLQTIDDDIATQAIVRIVM